MYLEIRSDRVPEELWTEVHNLEQEALTKTIPKEKKCKKTKWLSEEALQIAVKRRETRGKGEEERVPKKSKQIRKPSSMTNAKK